jgi:hypothetical protein
MRKYSTVRASAKEFGALGVEGLGIDDGGVDVGEDLELVRAAHVVAVAGHAVADDLAAAVLAHLAGLVGLDHALGGHAPDPLVGFDAHRLSPQYLQTPKGKNKKKEIEQDGQDSTG